MLTSRDEIFAKTIFANISLGALLFCFFMFIEKCVIPILYIFKY